MTPTLQDNSRLIHTLADIARRDVGKARLWKHRELYRSLPDNEVDTSPQLCAALALLAVLSGDIGLSNRYVSRLETIASTSDKPETVVDAENHLCYLALALPQKSKKNPLAALRAVEKAVKNGAQIPQLSITVNRPSIINGGRDFTRYGSHIAHMRLPLIAMAHILYGDHGVGMPDIAIAETLYQKNEIHKALVMIVATIPFIEQRGDVGTLFVAMYLQMAIMMLSGQFSSAKPMLESIRTKILASDADYLLPNLNALSAWVALYESDFDYINSWLLEAPDEHGEFCTLDRFAYFVKMRVYLMQGKHIALMGLAERIRPILVAFDRNMEMCELNLLLALSFFEQGEKERAFDLLDVALRVCEKFRYNRLIGDEGAKMYVALREYEVVRGSSPYLSSVMEIARSTGLLYPDYLKSQAQNLPHLTRAELDILRLLAAERTNAEIAEFLFVTVRTVKFHISNIIAKLSVKNRGQAVKVAREANII